MKTNFFVQRNYQVARLSSFSDSNEKLRDTIFTWCWQGHFRSASAKAVGRYSTRFQLGVGLSWSPPEIAADRMINTTVSFEEPGEYILWGRGV